MVGQFANQVDRTFRKGRKCSPSNSSSSSGTQNNDLGAALQTSITKVTTGTSPKAKYKKEKGSQFITLTLKISF